MITSRTGPRERRRTRGDEGRSQSHAADGPPSSAAGLVVCLLVGLSLSGWAVAGMAVWETQQPLLALAFVVLLPVTITMIVRAIRSIL